MLNDGRQIVANLKPIIYSFVKGYLDNSNAAIATIIQLSFELFDALVDNLLGQHVFIEIGTHLECGNTIVIVLIKSLWRYL